MRFIVALIALASMFSASVASATPDCRPCPYSCTDLGLGKKDCSFVSESRGICCVDLTQKGLELAKAQSQALKNDARNETCPPGFRPSEQKCSVEERRRGCKDMRLPGGLGCVTR